MQTLVVVVLCMQDWDISRAYLDEVVDDFQRDELIVALLDAGNEVEARIPLVYQLRVQVSHTLVREYPCQQMVADLSVQPLPPWGQGTGLPRWAPS